MLIKYLRYLKYIIIHKWFVFVECCKLGIPVRGLMHDLSKFKPSEFFPYAEHFYGEREVEREDGSYNPLEIGSSFDHAWLNHQHSNKHHWQYWILRGDSNYTKVLEIPEKYVKEMVADWRGAGRAITGEKGGTKDWYLKNRDKMELHDNSRKLVEKKLGFNID